MFHQRDRVQANYGRANVWKSGTVMAVHAHGRYDVRYDTGETECRIALPNIRYPVWYDPLTILPLRVPLTKK